LRIGAQRPMASLRADRTGFNIKRALIDLYNDPHVKDALAFRGGTALNTLFINLQSDIAKILILFRKILVQ